MKKNRILSLLLLSTLLVSLFSVPTLAAEAPTLECRNAILVDATHNEILLEKEAYTKSYPASITKVMTALLVLEAIEAGQLSPSSMITAHQDAFVGLSAQGSTANIKVGETMSVENLLYCLMLPSANEAANILAMAVSGTLAEFTEKMNEKAAELGCEGTHFANAHGLHNPDHYTTAYDISLFFRAALEHDLFRTIISTPSHTVPATNLGGERYFFNSNGLISNLYYTGYTYGKCIGGKTGTTDEAGRCLVSAAEDDDSLLISVILGSGVVEIDGAKKQGQFTESIKLLDHGFYDFHRVTITKNDEPVDKVAVTLSRQADEVMVKPQGSITRTLPVDLDLEQIESTITLFSDSVEAPVAEGQVLGKMTLSHEGTEYGTLDLVAVTSVERSELLYKKAQIISFFQNSGVKLALALVAVVIFLVALRFLVFRKRRRYRPSRVAGRRNYRGSRR